MTTVKEMIEQHKDEIAAAIHKDLGRVGGISSSNCVKMGIFQNKLSLLWYLSTMWPAQGGGGGGAAMRLTVRIENSALVDCLLGRGLSTRSATQKEGVRSMS